MPADSEIDTLFATPPDRFVAVRKELAAAAKKRGQGDLAIRIETMKRPSPVVWLANAVAREHPKEIAALLSVGEEIREAYASGEVDRVREATARRQQAVSAALRAARSIAGDAGRGANEHRLSRTFLGASMDAPQGALLARGRLEHEVEPPALGGLFGEAPKLAARKPKAAEKKRDAADAAAEAKAHAKTLRALEQATAHAELEAARAEKLAAAKLAAATDARKAAESAETIVRGARKLADEKRRELETLRSRGPKTHRPQQ